MEAAYGSVEDPSFTTYTKVPFTTYSTHTRNSFSFTSLLAYLLMPWSIYAGVLVLSSFDVAVVADYLLLFLVLCIGFVAFRVWWRSSETDVYPPGCSPAWLMVLFTTSLLGWTVGFALGEANYEANLAPYNTVQSLNNYSLVNPEESRGQALMDAGQIQFAPGTFVDVSKSMGFKSWNTYCVAPIVGSANHTGPFDFWAVGLNCCPPGQAEASQPYTCGAVQDSKASAGLRLMQDEQRPYFRLAVQQAEAAYNIHSYHPVFLYWLVDSQAEVDNYKAMLMKVLLRGMLCGLAIQAFLVVTAALYFAKTS